MKLIILDRDGVINKDSDNFIKTIDEFIPLPGSLDAITRLNKAGYTIAVATNQSGIARGYFDKSVLHAMHEKLASLLKELGGRIEHIAYCPHGPDDHCDCRKPKTGLLLQIKQHFNTELKDVIVVGDSLRDLQSAQAVEAKPILVKTGKGQRTLNNGIGLDNIPVYDSLADFVDTFLE